MLPDRKFYGKRPMNDDFRETLTLYMQRLLPLLSSLILLLLAYMPFFPMAFHPEVSLICVYYWMLHRPDVFNLFSVFVIGLAADLISSSPWGGNVFELLVLYVLVGYLLKYVNGKPFEIMWAGFVLSCLVVQLAKWFVLSFYYSQFLPLGMMIFSFLVTAAVYPLVSLINVFVQNKLMTDEA